MELSEATRSALVSLSSGACDDPKARQTLLLLPEDEVAIIVRMLDAELKRFATIANWTTGIRFVLIMALFIAAAEGAVQVAVAFVLGVAVLLSPAILMFRKTALERRYRGLTAALPYLRGAVALEAISRYLVSTQQVLRDTALRDAVCSSVSKQISEAQGHIPQISPQARHTLYRLVAAPRRVAASGQGHRDLFRTMQSYADSFLSPEDAAKLKALNLM